MKHKQHLLSTTRKAVEQKTTAAQGRSNALEEGIRKVRPPMVVEEVGDTAFPRREYLLVYKSVLLV